MSISSFIKGLFGKDALSAQPGTYSPTSSYTIVSAAYNVAPYLNQFIESIVEQTISSDKLNLIIVNDGSTDNTLEVAERWASLFPERITILTRDNGGQSAARNAGLQHVTTDWVTFVDPDDFLAADYFETVDRALSHNPDAVLLTTRFFVYDEKTGKTSSKHPLDWRFAKGDTFYSVTSEDLPITMSMAASFFRTSHIVQQGLLISTKIRPVFEDAHFVGRYLASESSGSVGFLGSAKYYYRKRQDESSTMDRSWDGTDRLLTVPREGHLDLFKFAQESRGDIPEFIKLTVLYDVGWYFRNHVDHPEICQHFTAEDIAEGRRLLEEDMRIIGYDTLFSPLNKSMGFDHKAALAKAYFNRTPPFQKVYLVSVDKEQSRLTFRTFVAMPAALVNDAPLEAATDVLQRNFLGKPFYNRYTFDIPFTAGEDYLLFDFGENLPVQIDVKGKVLSNGITASELLEQYSA